MKFHYLLILTRNSHTKLILYHTMRLKYFSILTFLIFVSTSLTAQLYDAVAGLRLGVPTSLSYKKIINENKAIEGYLGTRGMDDFRFVNVSGAYQIIQPIDLGGIEELYY